MNHHVIGYSILGIGAFFGIIAVAWWAREQLEKARDRQARREFDTAVAAMPLHDGDTYEWPADDSGYLPYYDHPGYEFEPPTRLDYTQPQPVYQEAYWPPAGEATRHFFGTDLVQYDPAADAAEFMRRMEDDTSSFIARITGELERVPA